jgi:hypothetical protein
MKENQITFFKIVGAAVAIVTIAYLRGNANDESGNGHHGTVHGATLTTDRFGNQDSAYLFDGQDDYIALPDNLDLVDGFHVERLGQA